MGENPRPRFSAVGNGTPPEAGVSRGSPVCLGLVLWSVLEEKFVAVVSCKLEGITYIRYDICFGN